MYRLITPAGSKSSLDNVRNVFCCFIALRQSIARIFSLFSSRAVSPERLALAMLHKHVQNIYKDLLVCTKRMNAVVVGAYWGDEGKGKIVDLLAADSDWVVRF